MFESLLKQAEYLLFHQFHHAEAWCLFYSWFKSEFRFNTSTMRLNILFLLLIQMDTCQNQHHAEAWLLIWRIQQS
jgi:hypothetical protein